MCKGGHRLPRRRGFTIIELALVLVIVGILATLAVTTYTRLTLKAKRVEAKSALKDLSKLEYVFYSENDRYTESFNLLSFEPGEYDFYTFTLTSGQNDFTGKAEGNLDSDPDLDLWIVHKEGVPFFVTLD